MKIDRPIYERTREIWITLHPRVWPQLRTMLDLGASGATEHSDVNSPASALRVATTGAQLAAHPELLPEQLRLDAGELRAEFDAAAVVAGYEVEEKIPFAPGVGIDEAELDRIAAQEVEAEQAARVAHPIERVIEAGKDFIREHQELLGRLAALAKKNDVDPRVGLLAVFEGVCSGLSKVLAEELGVDVVARAERAGREAAEGPEDPDTFAAGAAAIDDALAERGTAAAGDVVDVGLHGQPRSVEQMASDAAECLACEYVQRHAGEVPAGTVFLVDVGARVRRVEVLTPTLSGLLLMCTLATAEDLATGSHGPEVVPAPPAPAEAPAASTPDPLGRPHWPPRRVDLISQLEEQHALELVRTAAAAAAFVQRHPGFEPLPVDEASLLQRLVDDNAFCRAVELDYGDHVVAAAQGIEQFTTFERERAEQHRSRSAAPPAGEPR